jgi:hypothetical protein
VLLKPGRTCYEVFLEWLHLVFQKESLEKERLNPNSVSSL